MQVAGEKCCICSANIFLEQEGTWCARCGSVVHRTCIKERNEICPGCDSAIDYPERHFKFSAFCPECLAANQPASDRCRSCGARVRWDTSAEYDLFVRHIQQTSKNYRVRGLAELALAGISLGAFVLIFLLSTHGPVVVLPGILLLGMFVLIRDGANRLRRASALKRFE